MLEVMARSYNRMEADFAEIADLFKPGTLARLQAAYAEPGRAYHTARHIHMLLRLFAKLRTYALDVRAVKAAIYFHDAVYVIPTDPQTPPPRDNEHRSVALMEECAIDPRARSLMKAEQLIRATATHATTRDMDTRLLHDLDQSIMAASRSRYALFEQQIREEYKVYPHALYCAARMGTLRSFMERRRIFTIGFLSQQWEEPARANLDWAIEQLAAGHLPG